MSGTLPIPEHYKRYLLLSSATFPPSDRVFSLVQPIKELWSKVRQDERAACISESVMQQTGLQVMTYQP